MHRGFRAQRPAFSMIGMLITMVCIVVLFTIMMTSMNKAITGQGSQQAGTVRSVEDELYLYSLFQSMLAGAGEGKGTYLVPSELAGGRDTSLNTTANVFSAMVMQNYSPCKQLISGNEYSPYVWEKENYNFTAYDPAKNVRWDTTFMANLKADSNVSFAHMPLYGERYTKNWKSTLDSTFPILGNRGPKDGIGGVDFRSCGKNGVWGGHLVFGDGHIVFVNDATPNGVVFEMQGQRYEDNIFKMDGGPNGSDAI
ncbi:MAG: hypothetical protein L0219_02750, partial [Phycisphaerales bacterium]|nr:hypothetical protein [Phycisphaerales bacterium]